MTDTRTKYQAHVAAMFRLAAWRIHRRTRRERLRSKPKWRACMPTRVESENLKAAVEWRREELQRQAPGVEWPVLLDAAGLKDAPVFIIWHPKPIRGLAALVASEPLDSWKDWLALHLLERASTWLPRAFVEESFNFYGKVLNGTPQMRPRWQRGVDFVDQYLGDPAGQLYVKHYFPRRTRPGYRRWSRIS